MVGVRHALRVAVMLSACDEITPVYASVANDLGGFPRPVTPTPAGKREKHRAGQLTGKVWDALGGTGPIEVSGVMVYPIEYGEESQ